MYKLSKRSLDRLDGVHEDLIAVVKKAIQLTKIDFSVIEGVRTLEKQKEYLAKGATTTLKSRHLTGHAVDLAAWIDGVRWELPLYEQIADAMFAAAGDLDVKIEWGGHWKSFVDAPHFQLSWEKYPA